jgi:hypothetical protein
MIVHKCNLLSKNFEAYMMTASSSSHNMTQLVLTLSNIGAMLSGVATALQGHSSMYPAAVTFPLHSTAWVIQR